MLPHAMQEAVRKEDEAHRLAAEKGDLVEQVQENLPNFCSMPGRSCGGWQRGAGSRGDASEIQRVPNVAFVAS